MAPVRATGMPRTLRRALLALDRTLLTDGQLLDRYLASREEAAFEALLRRHGPMVLGVCCRVLRNAADAEDAFQATFLVLVRKGATVLPRNRVGNWLYGVAYRTALKARSTTARRQARERLMSTQEAFAAGPGDDWLPLLDHELHRLPEKYRLPIVLCDLEGKTRKEAARHLDWPEGTVATRLSRGRVILAQRLARKGLALTAGGLALGLSRQAIATGMSSSLVSATVRAATDYAACPAAAAAVSVRVAALTEGVLKTMLLTRLKAIAALALVLGLLGTGLGTGLLQVPAAPQDEPPAPTRRGEVVHNSVEYEDPDVLRLLPKGEPPRQALASLEDDGALTLKFRHLYLTPVTTQRVRPDGGVTATTTYRQSNAINITRVGIGEYRAYSAKLKKIVPKDLRKLLAEETPVLVFWSGDKIDPLHLRFIKDGTIVIDLPRPATPRMQPPAAPAPVPLQPPAPHLAPIDPTFMPVPAPGQAAPPQQALPLVPSITPPAVRQDPLSPVPTGHPQQPVNVAPSVALPTASGLVPTTAVPQASTTSYPGSTMPPASVGAVPGVLSRQSPLQVLLNQGGTDQVLFRIQGEWAVVAHMRDGKRVPNEEFRDYKVVIRDGQMWLSRGNSVLGGKKLRIEINAAQKPATIDTYIEGRSPSLISHGILEVKEENGMKLLTIYETPPDQPRPTAFNREFNGPRFVTLYKQISGAQ
jgi:RNA polymerase sigma factor (sigma-70 family)